MKNLNRKIKQETPKVFPEILSKFIRKYFKNSKNRKISVENTGLKFFQSGGGFNDLLYSKVYSDYKSYAYTCINARAENISKAKLILYHLINNSRQEIEEHPVLNLISRPNKRGQTFKEILHKLSSSLDLYGNAYLYIQRNYKGEPIALYHLPSKNVQIIFNKDLTEIERYEYFNGKYNIPYLRNDIIHFLIPDPDNSFSGKSIISGFNFTQEIDYLQNLYQRNFYRNDAALGLIIEAENELSAEVYERLYQQIENKYEGSENAGKTMILESGMKAKSYQSHPKDVEILPSRKMIRDEILSIFRVPKIILGIAEDVNRANSRESMKIFNDYVIKPFAKICIESKLNIFLKENYPNENLELNMEYEFEIDRDLQLKSIELYCKYGIATIDEIREIEGFSSKSN